MYPVTVERLQASLGIWCEKGRTMPPLHSVRLATSKRSSKPCCSPPSLHCWQASGRNREFPPRNMQLAILGRNSSLKPPP